jgi:hypothetical protein
MNPRRTRALSLFFIWLLSVLLGVGFIGCATDRPPSLTLEQWEASRRAAGLGIGGGD